MKLLTIVLAGALVFVSTPASATDLDAAVAAAMVGKRSAPHAGIEVNVQRSEGGWVFGSGVLKASPYAGAPESWLFVARRTGGGWQVALDDDKSFADLAQLAPSKVVSADEKQTFARWASNARVAGTQTGLSLPYPVGVSWTIIGGPHGWSGQPRPWSSIDLNGGDRRVLSAQSGRAYWMCSNGGHIRIIHDNGWTTEYYHLLNEIRPNGQHYPMGTYLGLTSTRVPCGGSAGSNHVHFALKQGGSWVALQDKTIGGWTYFEGSRAYAGGARRGSVTRTTGQSIQNYGPEQGGTTFENTTNFNVADLGSAESPIAVTGVPGNAPATLSVFADVHHTWRGDLRIDLIAPDGTAYRLRNPDPDDDADVIHETYTVNASSEVANGTWRLRVTDVAVNDSGYIDGWTITF